MRGLQNYARNWNLTVAFWATCKIGQPIQPMWQQFFALPWSALKKPSWELNFLHIFAVPLSSRHQKRCQILERLFVVFHHSRNIVCMVLLSNLYTVCVNVGRYVCNTHNPLLLFQQHTHKLAHHNGLSSLIIFYNVFTQYFCKKCL